MLNAAYGDGLLSEETFTRRLDRVLGDRVIDPAGLIGDLSVRGAAGWRAWLRQMIAAARLRMSAWGSAGTRDRSTLLALDWSAGHGELILGRHHACDVVFDDGSVSRRHARLVYRDGSWVLQDLKSTNGTSVNGVRVGRCALRPGDRVALGDQQLRID